MGGRSVARFREFTFCVFCERKGICGMVHIKYILLLIEKSIPGNGGSMVLLSLSEVLCSLYLGQYNRKRMC